MRDLIDALTRGIAPAKQAMRGVDGLPDMFENCFLNTARTTLRVSPGDTFVITGDIPAMWLRDSSAQVMHYVRFARDPAVAHMLEGLLARQARCVLLDAYANAFSGEALQKHPYADSPIPSPMVWERKYEIDSLCYPLLLAVRYMDATGSRAFLTHEFTRAMHTIVRVMETEQAHDRQSAYYFSRENCPPGDTLPMDGWGVPTRETGMVWSGFRPSDDACAYGLFVPGNLMAAACMRHAARLADEMGDSSLRARCDQLRADITRGIEENALVPAPDGGDMYAYETDGYAHYTLMDDGNVPSLLSLPYIGAADMNDPRYLRTRAFVLSTRNPYYFEGKYARGVGSPHTPQGYVWPISLCVQGMTTPDIQEKAGLLRMLLSTHAGTGLMHEGFDPNNPARFTREWFAWANSMFGEFVMGMYEQGILADVIAAMPAPVTE